MGEVVNLRLARKRKARAERETDAAASRALHGRTGAQKRADAAERRRLEAGLDAHRLDRRNPDADR